jgi:hypothetical protein
MQIGLNLSTSEGSKMENDDAEVDFSTIMFDPAITFGTSVVMIRGEEDAVTIKAIDMKDFYDQTPPVNIDAIKPWEPPVLDGYGRPHNRPWEACVLAEQPMSTVDILAAELQMSEQDYYAMDHAALLTINKRTLMRIIYQAQKAAKQKATISVDWLDATLSVLPPIHEQPKPKPEKSPKLHKLLFNPNDKV